MNEARDLYVRGFKQNDKDAMEEFLALSKAHFKVLGRTVIDEKFRFVDEHFVGFVYTLLVDDGSGIHLFEWVNSLFDSINTKKA